MEFLLADAPYYFVRVNLIPAIAFWCIAGTLLLKIVVSLGGSWVTLWEAFVITMICVVLQTIVVIAGNKFVFEAPTLQAKRLMFFIFLSAFFLVQPLVVSWRLSTPLRGGCFVTLAMLGLQILYLLVFGLLLTPE